MASIRRSKRPKGYERGGRVVADPETGELEMIPPQEPSPAVQLAEQQAEHAEELAQMHREHADQMAEISEPPTTEPNPLGDALAAAQRAEQLQQQWRQPGQPTFAAQIAELRESDPFRYQAASFYHSSALAKGIPDDTDEMKAYILDGIQAELLQQHKRAAENVRAAAAQPDALLPQPMTVQNPALPRLDQAIMPPKKNSIPMTAPPSRDVPSYSGKKFDDRKITLSPEERDVARRSYTAPDMDNAAKEYAYAQAKRKMLKMKANGEIQS